MHPQMYGYMRGTSSKRHILRFVVAEDSQHNAIPAVICKTSIHETLIVAKCFHCTADTCQTSSEQRYPDNRLSHRHTGVNSKFLVLTDRSGGNTKFCMVQKKITDNYCDHSEYQTDMDPGIAKQNREDCRFRKG